MAGFTKSFDSSSSLGAMAGMMTFRGDPAMIQMQGSVNSALAFAESEALRRQRDMVMEYGDPKTAEALFGSKDPTVKAAAENPFSIFKMLAKQYELEDRTLDESLNKANLWYSGEHERAAKLHAEDQLRKQYEANRQLQTGLMDIKSALAATRLDAMQQQGNQILETQRARSARV